MKPVAPVSPSKIISRLLSGSHRGGEISTGVPFPAGFVVRRLCRWIIRAEEVEANSALAGGPHCTAMKQLATPNQSPVVRRALCSGLWGITLRGLRTVTFPSRLVVSSARSMMPHISVAVRTLMRCVTVRSSPRADPVSWPARR